MKRTFQDLIISLRLFFVLMYSEALKLTEGRWYKIKHKGLCKQKIEQDYSERQLWYQWRKILWHAQKEWTELVLLIWNQKCEDSGFSFFLSFSFEIAQKHDRKPEIEMWSLFPVKQDIVETLGSHVAWSWGIKWGRVETKRGALPYQEGSTEP